MAVYVPVHDVVMVEAVTDTELETAIEVGVSTITIGEVVTLSSVPVAITLEITLVVYVPVQGTVTCDTGVSTYIVSICSGTPSLPVVVVKPVE